MRNIHFESVFMTDQATPEQLSIPLNKFPCYEATKSKRKRKRLWFPEEGPFICTECQENFESSDTLKSHWDKVCNLKTKSTVEKLCNLCGKTFQRNSHLKKHVRSIHEKIPYDCTGKVINLGRDIFSNPIFQTVLPDYKHPGMLCLALPSFASSSKSEFSMSKIIRISLNIFH